ncbi:hypothetical protein [Niallia nealsonii]|uniref:Uncharacterized protein n=1 Tax=Niallia nealsonii TaxID=115979 RepID=A0A2N0YZD1_9BACI|nr:hypothetical protein [Niallia nealsonii]PKG22620.1 hypothetical protein CWS01_15930 [Niallia nealsonii]
MRINMICNPTNQLISIYQSKIKRSKEVHAAIFLKITIRILRFQFGFSPEMIREFTEHFEKK